MDLSRVAPLGTRVSIRYADPDGAERDAVGEVVRYAGTHLELQPWDRGPLLIPLAGIRACRQVPPRAIRPSSPPADIERLASHQWPGLTMVRLGGWEIRRGNGCTRRANSTLPEGDPGTPLARAVEEVIRLYEEQGLVPRFRVAAREGERHGVAEDCASRGWSSEAPSRVLVADLRRLTAPTQGDDALVLSWADAPDADWLRSHAGDASFAGVVSAAPARYLTARSSGEAIGVARLAHTADWVGISSLWVDPAHRGHGAGRTLMAALLGEARRAGARFGYLEVADDNTLARDWYLRQGWQEHHRYAYWRP